MSQEKTSNYETACEQWRIRFLEMDQDQLMQRLPELKPEGDFLCLFHFRKKYGIHRRTGEIVLLSEEGSVPITVKLNLYTLFGYVSPKAALRGEWVPFENLRGTAPFAPAFRKGVIESYARTFTGHMDRLQAAMESMGGIRLPYSDLGYQVDAFACIPVRFLFWEGDDEFPAQANILFDASATDFIHGESIVSIAMVGLAQLAESAGLLMDPNAIPLM